ncbi:MAG: phage tail protein [Synergistaceae bacterium]|nr:phage tail protein [Synergistaceae bacterium]
MAVNPSFPGNPRQKHEFLVRVDGIDGGWFEKATLPTVENEVDEFNSAGSLRSTKFSGRRVVGECTLEKGVPADKSDLAAWNLLTSATNTQRGELGNPSGYKHDMEICETDHVGNVMKTYILHGAWVSKIEWSDLEGGSSEHVVETLTLTVDDVEVR